MGERREDLSTADLADQQPRDPARADLTEAADHERQDRGPDDLARDDLVPSPARTEDRAPDRPPDAELDPDRRSGRPTKPNTRQLRSAWAEGPPGRDLAQSNLRLVAFAVQCPVSL